MMRFHVHRILQRIMQRKGSYFMIMLQLALGMYILLFALTLTLNMRDDYKKLLKEISQMEFEISLYPESDLTDITDIFIKTDEPLRYEEFCDIKSKYQDLEINLDCFHEFFLANKLTGESDIYKLVYLDGLSCVQMSQDMYDIIVDKDSEYELIHNDFNIDDDTIQREGSLNRYPIQIIPGEECIYFPLEDYESAYQIVDIFNTRLLIKIKDFDNDCSSVDEIVSDLEENSKGIKFRLDNQYFSYMKRISIAREHAQVYRFLSILLLSIVLIGISGLFLVLTESRKAENAICLAMGQTKKIVYIENFFEVFSISFIGSMIGISLCVRKIIKGSNYAGVTLTISYKALIIVTVLIVVISVVSLLPSINKIEKLMPSEILKSE